MVFALAVLSGLAGLGPAGFGLAGAEAAPPPPAVGVSPVVVANIAPSSTNIGHVIAIQSVSIVPRVTAFIDEVNVKQGSTVAAGSLLFSLQKAQFEAALQTAQASLASAHAALENAQLAFGRAARLANTGFEAQSNLDTARATRDEDQANVLSAEANLANAQLNLSYCTITAPITGRVGIVSKTKGNLVTANSGTLITINQLDPIRVVFAVSTQDPLLATVQDGAALSVGLELPDGKTYPEKGKIAFFDNQVDSQTGTVNIYADFPNPKSLLLPGAYISVVVASAQPEDRALVPVSAVQTDQKGSFVLVVGADNKVAQRTVSLGTQVAQNFIVKSGLAAGERVIVEGAQKVKVGQVVAPSVVKPAGAAGSSGESN